MSDSKVPLLSDAVARGAGLVLSLPSPDGLTHYKSRFLEEDPAGVWAESPPVPRLIQEQLIPRRKAVGITFKAAGVRHVFVTSILRRQPARRLPGGRVIDAVLVAFPSELKVVQRRANYRVRVSPDSGLSLNCWIIGRRTDLRERPMPSQKLKLEVSNLSLGGASVTIHGQNGQPPAVTPDDRLRVEVRFGDLEFLVEGRVRSRDETIEGAIRTGIRFYFLDDGLDERLKVSQLDRIIGQLQVRQVKEVRRKSQEGVAAAL